MCVYCFLILRVAEGLAIALSGTSSGLAQGLPGLSVTPPGALVSLSKVGCADACLFARGGPAGAGVFGAVVITGMAQP